MYCSHDAKEIAAPELFYVLFAESFGSEFAGKVDDLRSVGTSNDAAIAVKVGTYAYMVDASYADHVYDVAHGIFHSSAALFA